MAGKGRNINGAKIIRLLCVDEVQYEVMSGNPWHAISAPEVTRSPLQFSFNVIREPIFVFPAKAEAQEHSCPHPEAPSRDNLALPLASEGRNVKGLRGNDEFRIAITL